MHFWRDQISSLGTKLILTRAGCKTSLVPFFGVSCIRASSSCACILLWFLLWVEKAWSPHQKHRCWHLCTQISRTMSQNKPLFLLTYPSCGIIYWQQSEELSFIIMSLFTNDLLWVSPLFCIDRAELCNQHKSNEVPLKKGKHKYNDIWNISCNVQLSQWQIKCIKTLIHDWLCLVSAAIEYNFSKNYILL